MSKFFKLINDFPLRFVAILLVIVFTNTFIAQAFYYHKPILSFKTLIVPLNFVMDSLLTTTLIFTGLKFREINVSFTEVFKAVVIGASVFVCQYVLELFYLFFNTESSDHFHLSNFSSFSLFHLYHPEDLPFYLVYPFQTVNLWEISNVILIIWSLKLIITPRKYKHLGSTITISYLIGLFTWILIVVYINLNAVK